MADRTCYDVAAFFIRLLRDAAGVDDHNVWTFFQFNSGISRFLKSAGDAGCLREIEFTSQRVKVNFLEVVHGCEITRIHAVEKVLKSLVFDFTFDMYIRCMIPKSSFKLLLFALIIAFETSGQSCEVTFEGGTLDTLCPGNAPQLLPEGIPSGGTYSSEFVTDVFFDPTDLLPGIYEVLYNVDAPGCSGTAILNVFIPPPAEEIHLTGAFNICPGQGARIYTDRIQVTWADGIKDTMHVFAPLTDTTSYFSFQNSYGCVQTQYFTIHVNGISPNAEITGGGVICEGSPVTLALENAEDAYPIWPDTTTTLTYDVPNPVSQVINVPVTNIWGCVDTLSAELIIEPGATLEIVGDSIVCFGDSLHLEFFGGDKFYIDGNLIVGNTYSAFIEVNQEIEITSQYGTGCSYQHILPVIVNPSPTISLSPYENLCEGELLSIFAFGGEYYELEDMPSGEITLVDPLFENNSMAVIFADTLNQDLHFIVRAINSYQCPDAAEVFVEALSVPNVAVVPLTPFCEERIITLSGTGADTYHWFDGGDEINEPTVSYFGNGIREYRLIGINNTGCRDTLFYTTELHPVPTISAVGDDVICQGYSATISASGAITYEWGNVLSGDTITIAPQLDSTILVVGASEFGCKDSLQYFLQVLPAPILEIQADDTELCFGESTWINLNTNSSFQWTGGSIESAFIFAPATDSLLFVSAVGENGCDKSDSLLISVIDLPIVTINGPDAVCEGESITLVAAGAVSYHWTNGVLGEQLQSTPIIATTYTVVGTSADGCDNEAALAVNVHPVPYAYFQFNVDTICDLGPAVSWVANPSGGVLTGDGVQNNAFNPQSALTGVNTVTYTLTNDFGCTATDSDVIVVDDCSSVEDLTGWVPVFYPNPAEDVLNISGLPGGTVIQVWNVAGQLVWSGTYNGHPLLLSTWSPGVYAVQYSVQGITSTARIVKQ
jgi:Secretion system C-terminal sorting domain